MDEAAFREQIKPGGYGKVSVSEYEAGYVKDTHAHDFGASVLVVDGEISVTLEDRVVTCRAGDTFSLEANISHAESVGTEGVRLLAARK
ncbi:MAG: cupin domain-containing protein [Alphaproteobacteria bacterium]